MHNFGNYKGDVRAILAASHSRLTVESLDVDQEHLFMTDSHDNVVCLTNDYVSPQDGLIAWL